MQPSKILILDKIFILLIFLFSSSPGQYKIDRSVFGNGIGKVNSSTYKVNTVIGQPGIGLSSNTFHRCHFGFWYSIVDYLPIAEKFENQLPTKYELFQNYPNPFNPTTTIDFDIPKTSEVTLKIFNILGEEVATLVSDKLTASSYTYQWNASHLASGIYLYRLSIGSLTTKSGHSVSGEAGYFVETKKMILMR